MNAKTYATITDIALLFSRLTLGLLFLLAGVRKLLPGGGQGTLEKWSGFADMVAGRAPLPSFLGLAYGYALPPVEIIAGALLMLGLFTRVNALLIGLMLLSFMLAMGINWWPESGPAFDKNVILFALTLVLVGVGGGRFALEPVIGRSRKVKVG